MASVNPSESSMGLCSKCGHKCADTWRASPCGHGTCNKCLETAGHSETCLGCRKTVSSLVCPGNGLGCKFDTTQGSWKDHVLKCLVFPRECPNQCGEIVVRKQLPSHLMSDCQLRLSTCQFCQETVFELEVRDHEDSCPKAPVSCSYCHREGLKREEMEHHAKNCSETPKPCPLVEFGCCFSGVDKDVDQHLTVRNHVGCFEEVKKSQQELRQEIEKLRYELDSCKNRLAELSNGGGAIFFDKEVRWAFETSTTGSDCLLSPLYRHRQSGAVVYFGLSFPTRRDSSYGDSSYEGDNVSVRLYRYQTLFGKATISGSATVVLYSLEHSFVVPGTFADSSRTGKGNVKGGKRVPVREAKTEIAKEAGIPPSKEVLLNATMEAGEPYVMHYVHED